MAGGHEHAHADAAMLDTERGVWAVKLSILILGATATLQLVVVLFSGSAALLADTLHNFADAATGIPLLIAFALSSRVANRRYTYGYHRSEDLAGLIILLVILASAIVSAWASYQKLINLSTPSYLGVAMVAAVIGYVGNEAAARLRIRVGTEIGSAALVADGHHARTDSFTSLGALVGLVGAYLGFPIADPLVGLVISALIFLIVIREAGPPVLRRVLDAMDPQVIESIETRAAAVPGVRRVETVRARWLGHRIRAELEVAVDGTLSVADGHAISEEVRHALLHDVARVSEVVVHVDPDGAADAHALTAHHYDGSGHEDEHDHDDHDHDHEDHRHADAEHAHDEHDDHAHDHAEPEHAPAPVSGRSAQASDHGHAHDQAEHPH